MTYHSEAEVLAPLVARLRAAWTATIVVEEPASSHTPSPDNPFMLARVRFDRFSQEAIGGRKLQTSGAFIVRLLSRPSLDAALEQQFVEIVPPLFTYTVIEGIRLWDATLSSGVRDGAWRVRMFETAIRVYAIRDN